MHAERLEGAGAAGMMEAQHKHKHEHRAGGGMLAASDVML